MAKVTITVCDGCGKELKGPMDTYHIDFQSDTFLDGAGDIDYNLVQLEFCKTCTTEIKDTLLRISNNRGG